jgi:hypothetical protein
MRFAPNRRRWRLARAAAAAFGLAACTRETGTAPPAANPTPAPATATDSAVGTAPHGDHNPHHGGVVLMKGEMHYEVVLDPTGRAHHVYFTDAVREELPASIASRVVLTIRRASAEEPIAMQIDETGESWVGSGQPVAVPAQATARVEFWIGQDPYWIDIPFSAPLPTKERGAFSPADAAPERAAPHAPNCQLTNIVAG